MASEYPSLSPGRVVTQQKGMYCVAQEEGEIFAQVSGKLRFESPGAAGFPAVGDFVMMEGGVIRSVLPRRSAIVRKAAGKTQEGQVISANVDIVFVCMGLDADYNLRRLERYLTLVWDSGAVPLVVLTKSDLCESMEEKIAEIQDIALGAQVIVTSGLLEGGAAVLIPYIKGKTVAFIGSSGVGKSTLVNALSGEEVMETGGTRRDGKGRHTTTYRELFPLCGGAVIDTPGMRELGLSGGDFSRSFADIEELAEYCRFRDCAHKAEPGCAVRQAVEEGTLSEERLESYHKLKKEAGYEGLNSREISAQKRREMFAHMGGEKNAKNYVKNMDKYR
jgi:ribosome biogenesis GTPase / thiamine phosphate phosphatase